MPIFKWEEGRQGGYEKLTIFSSKLFKCDLHLIRLRAFDWVSYHRDPAPDGYEHHRINFDIFRPAVGGVTHILDEDYPPRIRSAPRCYRFRPDLHHHEVTTVMDPHATNDFLLILSFGWLRKTKPPVTEDSDDLWMYGDCDD